MSESSLDIESLIATGKEAMESALADGEDLLPIMLIDAGGILNVVGLAVDGNPADYLAASMAAIDDLGRVESVSFTADTYYVNDATVPRPYSVAFAAGDPRVMEALAITVVIRDQDDMLVLLPYTRTAGRLEWGQEVRHQGEGLGGRVTEALRRAMVGSGS